MRELGMIISDKVLQSLCQKHLHEIGAGIDTFLPDIIVRYVSEIKKFGYTRYGNFFFLGDDFYVWEKDDKYAEDHNQDVVEAVFGVECEGRGYARRVIFAGVQTGFNIFELQKINLKCQRIGLPKISLKAALAS